MLRFSQLSAAVGIVAVFGCAGGPVRLHAGPSRSASQVAVLVEARHPEAQPWIGRPASFERIGDHDVHESLNFDRTFELLPGTYQVTASYPNVGYPTPVQVEMQLVAGERYWMRAFAKQRVTSDSQPETIPQQFYVVAVSSKGEFAGYADNGPEQSLGSLPGFEAKRPVIFVLPPELRLRSIRDETKTYRSDPWTPQVVRTRVIANLERFASRVVQQEDFEGDEVRALVDSLAGHRRSLIDEKAPSAEVVSKLKELARLTGADTVCVQVLDAAVAEPTARFAGGTILRDPNSFNKTIASFRDATQLVVSLVDTDAGVAKWTRQLNTWGDPDSRSFRAGLDALFEARGQILTVP